MPLRCCLLTITASHYAKSGHHILKVLRAHNSWASTGVGGRGGEWGPGMPPRLSKSMFWGLFKVLNDLLAILE